MTTPTATRTRALGAQFRHGHGPEAPAYPGHGYARQDIDGLSFERDVAVPMRDGVIIYVDIWRPFEAKDVPTLVIWGPFGKHPHTNWDQMRGAEVPIETLSPYTIFEAPDPIRWGHDGYAIVQADPRGTWYSQGEATYYSPEEAEDGYDLIEWLAAQEWSNGRVGWGSCSYMSMTAWAVAAIRPPHLTCILAWEAMSNVYREAYAHGGIPTGPMTHSWMHFVSSSIGLCEDMETAIMEHPLYDAYWQSKVADWSKVVIPTFAVTSWGEVGLHLRGTIEAFNAIASPQKWLMVHNGKEWAEYYRESSVLKQKAFFDHFLKGQDAGLADWPRVQIAVRTGGREAVWRAEPAWPLARARHTAFYLDCETSIMVDTPPPTPARIAYDSRKPDQNASFELRFDTRTEITGYAKLRLWIAAPQCIDADLFVALRKFDRAGNPVHFLFYGMYDDGDVSHGWLRVSHRELDAAASRPEKPVYQHARRLWLTSSEPVAADIEIWPSSTVFEAGESLRVVIAGSDLTGHADAPFALKHAPLHNWGDHVIAAGGSYDSYLLLPIIPQDHCPGAKQ